MSGKILILIFVFILFLCSSYNADDSQLGEAGPDLVVETLACDPQDTALQKTDLNFHCTVRNVGSAGTGTFFVDFYPDLPAPPGTGQYGPKWLQVSGGLAPGASADWDFTYNYVSSGLKQMYVQVDSDAYVSEVNEGNNILGPQALQVNEFERIEDTYDAVMGWFGGDDRDGWTRNVGCGQSITLPRSAQVEYAGFHFWQRFDYYQNPAGAGHPVTLVLDIRAADGTLVKSVTRYVPASFEGGWILFGVDADLWAGDTYIFTCFLQDGHTNHLMSSLRARQDDPWPDSAGYYLDNRTSPYDMKAWENWYPRLGDFNFRIAGIYTDLSKSDFTRNYRVDLEDVSRLAVRWLHSDCLPPAWCGLTDLDYSGRVDLSDLQEWAIDWLWEGYGPLNRPAIAAMDAQLSAVAIDGSDGNEFRPGTCFVYKTGEGRYGKCIVEKWQPDVDHQLTIGWITYNSNGTIYSTGTGLVIRGSFSCDLDLGAETGAGADWDWNQSTASIRTLIPTNGAKFKLIYRAPQP